MLDQPVSAPVLDDAEAAAARAAVAALADAAAVGAEVRLAPHGGGGAGIVLPARAVALVRDVLAALAEGRPVSVVAERAELTTQEAADRLGVSRPFLVGLLDRGEIPHRVVGRHRRVRPDDLLAYERASAERRRAALAEMASEARRLGLD